MSNIVAQYIGVALALLIAVGWIVKRILRRRRCEKSDCGCSASHCACDGCELAEHCRKKSK